MVKRAGIVAAGVAVWLAALAPCAGSDPAPASSSGSEPSADQIVQKCVQALGGMDRIQGVRTLRRTGRLVRGGGFELGVEIENSRPDRVRQEIHRQGMVGIHAWDGKVGWRIQPWQGKKDPEPLSEAEMKGLLEDADFDGPLVNYRAKGNRIEYRGRDEFEGTDVLKLRVTDAHGTVYDYDIDAEYDVPIRLVTKRMIRGAQQEHEALFGDYKQVAGWYLPYSIESGEKGGPYVEEIYDSIEANVPIDPSRYSKPGTMKPAEPRP